MTEENHQTESSSSSTRSSPLVQAETQANAPEAPSKTRDVKKEKCRAMTKVVIRRLPPSMNQAQFIEQISPLPDNDYMYFVKADMSLGQFAFSRVYINFVDQRDIFIFREKFDNYVFVDSKGTEYPAVVEFAPFQRLPKKRVGKKKDVKCGSIESDPYYVSFLESLQNQEGDAAAAQPKTEYSYQPADNTQKKVTTTPLLEYLKQRKQEKQRLKDEKREERRRRDLERRRAKDEPTISKVLKNPEMEKESVRELKDTIKEDKDKKSVKDTKNRNKREEKVREKVGNRERESKQQGKQQQQQQPQQQQQQSSFGRERGEERTRDREPKHQKRHDDKKSHGKREDKDRETGKEDRKQHDGKFPKDEKRTDGKDEPKEPKEPKERKLEEKRGKSYEKMRLEKKRLAENKKGGVAVGESAGKANATIKSARKEGREIAEETQREEAITCRELDDELSSTCPLKDILADPRSIPGFPFWEAMIANMNVTETGSPENSQQSRFEHDFIAESASKPGNRRKEQNDDDAADANSPKSRIHEIDCCMEFEDQDCSSTKKNGKIVLRRSSLESGADGGGGDGARLRRHKSLDGGENDNLRKNERDYKTKNKKDPRLERRIRNKDRPAMEIYRPGMGRFSKQRLEREKSMNDDRASLSQSPTPTTSQITPSAKSSSKQAPTGQPATSPSSEMRSMTFKRSASRDLP